MVLDVFLQDERGGQLEAHPDAIGAASLVSSVAEGSNLLRYIDPYGNTIFNRQQCMDLLGEWDRVIAAAPADIRAWAEAVRSAIRRCAEEVHLYVRFSGD